MKLRLHWMTESIRRGTDENCGAALTQITSAALVSHDIYCEERYTSADGRLIAFLRSSLAEKGGELWLHETGTPRVARLCHAVHGQPASSLFSDNLYYVQGGASSPRVLMRVNLSTLEQDEIADLTACPFTRHPIPTVSPDDRYFVGNCRLRDNIWGLYRVDLGSGAWEIFHEHADICNPHPQFEPARGEELLIQLNHGCVVDEDENYLRLVGEQGATLYLIHRDGGELRSLPVGLPYTGGITGHECWVGDSGQILLTLIGERSHEIHLVAPGDERSRCLWKGLLFNHISVSSDGQYFVTDDMSNSRLYIGSIETGRMLPFCESGASFGGPQYSHPHAYMTPDNARVVFNSDRTGLAQVWCAEIPDGFLAALDLPHEKA